ncbi:hypothetical protein OH76DRAFT_1415080 [Lentinus brumalis]|uniref:Uncharacterized protein n=1 Tax=Lentinus brumalis TaxID=2498619 RepID=A0A371DR99_9APHY|nr:hypothetical protein OH76DRAFT_1415080 [Polyporus brumalis]
MSSTLPATMAKETELLEKGHELEDGARRTTEIHEYGPGGETTPSCDVGSEAQTAARTLEANEQVDARKATKDTPNGGDRAGSQDSAALWEAVATPPRIAPVLALFDEHESNGYEEGEVETYEEEDRGPPPNQEAIRTQERADARERGRILDEAASEHRFSSVSCDNVPTARKRSWAGSAISEEERRTARRPRLVNQEDRSQLRLPPVREMFRNPWRGMSVEESRSPSLMPHVTTSTPRLAQSVHEVSPFYHDEFANVSGHPPTMRGSSIDSPTGETDGRGYRSSTNSPSHSEAQNDRARMDVDDADQDGSYLLDPPRRPQEGRGTSPFLSEEVGPWSLRNALSEHEAGGSAHGRDLEALWRGGYRPRNWETENARRTERWSSREADERRDSGEEGVESRWSNFSALPNTKAWEYRRQEAEPSRRGIHELSMTPAPRETTRGRTSGLLDERPESTNRDASHGRRAGGRMGQDDGVEGTGARTGTRRNEERDGGKAEWWQNMAVSRLPSALRKDEDLEDLPVVVDNPQSNRWTIHLSDPEERYAGMSKDWMKTVWMDEKPIVLFTVYNYKYTKNQEINRHIEASVTSLTTHLTGESGFHVVPPDPEWRQDFKARDLPYLWVIRGLSEAAAWEMVKAHIISSRGVSIITHTRSLENPRFVCGLAGFLKPDVKATKAAVLSILESTYMIQRLSDLVRTNARLAHLTVAKRVESVIESVDVRFMATKEDGDVANIYIMPPTDDLDEWREWADEMKGYRYNNFLNGTGTARKAFWCGGCRGVDHEEQECPFQKMRGWKGPTAGTRSHSKFWEPSVSGGRRGGRGRGLMQWGPEGQRMDGQVEEEVDADAGRKGERLVREERLSSMAGTRCKAG